ncbi:unnamed protein product [Diamesa serratosioi]
MSNLLKMFLVLCLFLMKMCHAQPLSEETNLVDSGYEQDITGAWMPIQQMPAPNYWPVQSTNLYNRNYPSYNSRVKAWLISPSKRNSELINSLLSLPKNMNDAGK